MRAEFDTREVRKLILELENAPARATRRLREAVRESADDLVDDWRRNARQTSGRHGKHYPRSIGADYRDGGLTAVVGPDASMPQGGMSFEYGSRNQKPHLGGNRAMDGIEPRFRKRVADAAEVEL